MKLYETEKGSVIEVIESYHKCSYCHKSIPIGGYGRRIWKGLLDYSCSDCDMNLVNGKDLVKKFHRMKRLKEINDNERKFPIPADGETDAGRDQTTETGTS